MTGETYHQNKLNELKQIEQDGRDAFRRGDNVNPYADIPTLLTPTEREDWEDQFEAWGIEYIEASRK